MRIRLEIRRHGLPPVKVLWITTGLRPGSGSPAPHATVAQLLEQVTEVVPLEIGSCGLENYVVEAQGYECLHFCLLDQILQEDQEVTIRPLEFTDLRCRRISGRHQISADGRHLIDGVAFGRPFLKPGAQSALRLKAQSELHSQLVLMPSDKLTNDETDCSVARSEQDEEDLEGVDLSAELASLEDEERAALSIGDSRKYFSEDPAISRVRKRKYAEELGIDGGGVSPLSRSEVRSEDPLKIPKKQRNGPTKLQLVPLGQQSSRSSTRSVRFAGDGLETPATIRDHLASEDDSSDSDFLSSSSESDKENRHPKMAAAFVSNEDDDDDDDDESSDSESATSSSGSDTSSESLGNPSPSSRGSTSWQSHPAANALDDILSSSSSSSDHSSTPPERSEGTPEIFSSRNDQRQRANQLLIASGIDLQEVLIDKNISQSTAAVAPGAGKGKTRARNARRKAMVRLTKLKEAGILPANATLQDSRDWCATFTELEIRDRIWTAVEKKRESLLNAIATGVIDDSVPGLDKLSGREKSGLNKGCNAEVAHLSIPACSRSPRGTKRGSSIDSANPETSAWGSLGLKRSQFKAEESRSKVPRMQGIQGVLPLYNKSPIAQEAGTYTTAAALNESWQDKVILAAVECCGRAKLLSTPPFPFVQRWHQKSRSRKKGAAQTSPPVGENTNEQLHHDCEDVDERLQGDMEDLPFLPDDLSMCKVLSKENAHPGAIIAFKQFELSKATNWSPIISGFRTARIREIDDDGNMTVILAKRDWPKNEREYDSQTGTRLYSGFEAPDSDEREDQRLESGLIEITLSELIEPFIAFPGDAPSKHTTPSASYHKNGGAQNSLTHPEDPPNQPILFEGGACAPMLDMLITSEGSVTCDSKKASSSKPDPRVFSQLKETPSMSESKVSSCKDQDIPPEAGMPSCATKNSPQSFSPHGSPRRKPPNHGQTGLEEIPLPLQTASSTLETTGPGNTNILQEEFQHDEDAQEDIWQPVGGGDEESFNIADSDSAEPDGEPLSFVEKRDTDSVFNATPPSFKGSPALDFHSAKRSPALFTSSPLRRSTRLRRSSTHPTDESFSSKPVEHLPRQITKGPREPQASPSHKSELPEENSPESRASASITISRKRKRSGRPLPTKNNSRLSPVRDDPFYRMSPRPSAELKAQIEMVDLTMLRSQSIETDESSDS